MAATFYKNKLNIANARLLELELENHNLKDSIGSAVKQEPGVIVQLEAEIVKQKSDHAATLRILKDVRHQLGEQIQYSDTVRRTLTSVRGSEAAVRKQNNDIKKNTITTGSQAKAKIRELQAKLDQKSREVVDFRTKWKREEMETTRLRGVLHGTTLGELYGMQPSYAPAPTTPPSMSAPAPTTSKRKWSDLTSSKTYDPKAELKKSVGKERPSIDDCRDDSEHDIPLTKRQQINTEPGPVPKTPLIGKTPEAAEDGSEDDVPLMKRKLIAPTSQMAKIKLEPGTAPQSAWKAAFIEDESEDDIPLIKRQRSTDAGDVEMKSAPKRTALGGSGR